MMLNFGRIQRAGWRKHAVHEALQKLALDSPQNGIVNWRHPTTWECRRTGE